MQSILNKPFPREGINIKSVRTSFLIGCFVALFLIVFEPFGISEWNTDHTTLKLVGFGMVSFIMPLLINTIIAGIIHKKPLEDNWTVGREIIAIITVLIFVALGNMVYGSSLHIIPFTVKGFVFAFITVIAIGVFPVSLHVLRKHNVLFKINSQKAITVNQHLHPEEMQKDDHLPEIPFDIPVPTEPNNVHEEIKPVEKLMLTAENEKDKIELLPEQLLFIESADNYSNLVFIENEQVKKQLIRSSLKRIESQLKVDFILRCHRTYIVNLKNVKKVDGNAAGYKLSFEKAGYFVPVSRNYGNPVLEKLKNLK